MNFKSSMKQVSTFLTKLKGHCQICHWNVFNKKWMSSPWLWYLARYHMSTAEFFLCIGVELRNFSIVFLPTKTAHKFSVSFLQIYTIVEVWFQRLLQFPKTRIEKYSTCWSSQMSQVVSVIKAVNKQRAQCPHTRRYPILPFKMNPLALLWIWSRVSQPFHPPYHNITPLPIFLAPLHCWSRIRVQRCRKENPTFEELKILILLWLTRSWIGSCLWIQELICTIVGIMIPVGGACRVCVRLDRFEIKLQGRLLAKFSFKGYGVSCNGHWFAMFLWGCHRED